MSTLSWTCEKTPDSPTCCGGCRAVPKAVIATFASLAAASGVAVRRVPRQALLRSLVPLQHFLHEGRPSYVVDNVERGRAGWCPLHGAWEKQRPILRTEQEAWEVFRIGPPDGYESRRPYEGCLFPVEHLAELSRQQVPRWTTTTSLSVSAISALVRKIGRCVLIGHSDFIDLSPMYQRLQGRWVEHVDGVKAAGTSAEYFSLPKMGHPGNSHMMMMDTNSGVVAALIGQWINAATAGE